MTTLIPAQSSTLNSSTTALGSSATFTGTAELNGHPDLMVSCQTDAAGTLFLDFSNDGTNWSTFPVAGFAVAAGIHEFHTAVKGGRYYRARLVNGSSAQTYLRLYCYSGTFSKVPNAPINQSIGADSDAMLVRPAAEFEFEIARGQVGGYSILEAAGRNPETDTTTDPEDVWGGGGDYTGQPVHSAAAETIEVFSSSANDTSAGTGARTVLLEGRDANFDEQTETVTLNGTTAVATTGTWKRMPRMSVQTAGSGGGNAGTITARHTTTTANVFAVMPAGLNESQIAAATMKQNATGLLVALDVSLARASGAAGAADVALLRRPEGGVYRAVRFATITDSQAMLPISVPIPLAEKDDLKVRILSVSDNDTIISATFDIVVIDD